MIAGSSIGGGLGSGIFFSANSAVIECRTSVKKGLVDLVSKVLKGDNPDTETRISGFFRLAEFFFEGGPIAMTETYVLHIDALDPKTLPLARLAEYMNRFAKILGHEEGVHFDGIRSGSTNIACRVDPNHAKVIGEGLQALVDGRGAKASRSAYGSMMKMLAKDKAKAAIFESDESGAPSEKIIDFSQVLPRCDEEIVVEQYDEISGYLIDIDAERDPAKLRIRNGERIYTGIRAEREIAKEMAIHLYRAVRIFGKATWIYSVEGVWDLERFEINEFKRLKETNLLDLFEKIRKIEGIEWRNFDDPQAAFYALRHGPE